MVCASNGKGGASQGESTGDRSSNGAEPGYISVYWRKLIDDQIIMPASYGYVQFMLPFFDRFVEEQIMFDEF
ncbi:hypothetical protein [Limosilactobacillus reuteri]|uniref:hypothetical protein n=1 Tax=Limosilactobacillus reuteri TaxID=1598 RepID=UPI002F267C1A